MLCDYLPVPEDTIYPVCTVLPDCPCLLPACNTQLLCECFPLQHNHSHNTYQESIETQYPAKITNKVNENFSGNLVGESSNFPKSGNFEIQILKLVVCQQTINNFK